MPKSGFEVTIDLDLQLKVIIFAYFGLSVFELTIFLDFLLKVMIFANFDFKRNYFCLFWLKSGFETTISLNFLSRVIIIIANFIFRFKVIISLDFLFKVMIFAYCSLNVTLE